MAITDGYRTHTEGSIHRYRVPDLLTEEEFKIYMASTYGLGVDFRELTEDESNRLDSGEPIVFVPYGPTDRDRERAALREQLGITALEAFVGMERVIDPDKRDPIVELDSRVMSRTDFEAKYGEQAPPSPPVEKEDQPVEETDTVDDLMK